MFRSGSEGRWWGFVPSAWLCVLGALAAPGASAGGESPAAVTDYEQLLEARYIGPVTVPEEGVVLELDVVRITLRSGRLWLAEPIASGAVTGLVFEGDGRFEMDVPDEVELRQLMRFAADDELERIDGNLERLVLRTSSPEMVPVLTELMQNSPVSAADAAPNALARARHDLWLRRDRLDVDARIIAALRTLGDRYVRADLKLDRLGWLTFEYDGLRHEELELSKYQGFGVFPVRERWLRLDRLADRREDGRPSARVSGAARLDHVDATVDLRELGRGASEGFGDSNPINGDFQVEARYVALRGGVGALILELDTMAQLRAVTTAAGEPLSFLRYPIGRLALHRDKREASPQFVVLLDEPLLEGQELMLDFAFDLEIGNFVEGMVWYPRPVFEEDERLTARLELLHRKYYGAVAMGRKVSETEDVDGVHTVWVLDQPSKMLGFGFGRYPHSRRYEEPGYPPITIFSTRGGYLSAERIEEVAERFVIGPVRFFQDLLGRPIESPELFVALISKPHGQAFPGLLHISDRIAMKGAFGRAIHGTKDLFVAHEVAHQYWGHEVSWRSYRDQWLGEALAEYSALLYVEAEVDDGERTFRKALDAYRREVTGSIRGAFNPFARAGIAMLNQRDLERLGPIGHGFRSATHEAPTAYFTMAYRKGALVLHMIRGIVTAKTGSDEAFVELLRELLERGARGTVGTEDLQSFLMAHVEYDWQRFFDQWVYGAEVPRWTARTSVEELCSGRLWAVHLRVEQDEVPESFTSLAPVRLILADGATEEHWVEISGELTELVLQSTRRPERVLFNPDAATLTRNGTTARTREPADQVRLAELIGEAEAESVRQGCAGQRD